MTLINESLSLAGVAAEFEKTIQLQDRKYRSKSYQNAFLGEEAVSLVRDILIRGVSADEGGDRLEVTREHAEIVCQQIQSRFRLCDRAGSMSECASLYPIVDSSRIYVLFSKEHRAPSAETSKTNDAEFFAKLFGGKLQLKPPNQEDETLNQSNGGISTDELFQAAYVLENTVKPRTHYNVVDGETVSFPNSFIGTEAVDLLLEYEKASNRGEALVLGRRMADEFNLLRRCSGSDGHCGLFEDNYYFFEFTPFEERTPAYLEYSDRSKMKYQRRKSTDRIDSLEEKKVKEIAEDFKKNVQAKDRVYRNKKYRNSFVASEAIDFLIGQDHAENRAEGAALCRRIMPGLFRNAGSERSRNDEKRETIFGGTFRDDAQFYAFDEDEEDEDEDEDEFESKTNDEEIQKQLPSPLSKGATTRLTKMYQEDAFDFRHESKVVRWLRSFRRLDPRFRILRHFRGVSQQGDRIETPDLSKMDVLVRMWYMMRRKNVFTVWRETQNVAIKRMMKGEAVGKGLDIKGKSAKRGELAGFVPFLQIGENKHKKEVSTLFSDPEAKVRVFFQPSLKKKVLAKIEERQKEILKQNTMLKVLLDSGKINDDQKETFRTWEQFVKAWQTGERFIEPLIDTKYTPARFGFEISLRFLWEVFFQNEDLTRDFGSQYDTGRPSSPKYQDKNIATLIGKPKDGCPRPVIVQRDGDDPFNTQEFLMAYEEEVEDEEGTKLRVLPVASDFDAFLIGTRSFHFDPEKDDFPPDQSEFMQWYIEQIGRVLDTPPRPGNWMKRWDEQFYKQKEDGFKPVYPPFPLGYADRKSGGIVENAVKTLAIDGSVRHGPESFNFIAPQEMEEKFLVISDCRGMDFDGKDPWYFQDAKGNAHKHRCGTIPWRRMNETELKEFLANKIKKGFTFPLNPKWILCDPGWKDLYDKLIASTDAEVVNSMAIWYPQKLREEIEDISSRHPFGFEGCALRSQEEVRGHFKPILIKDNWPHVKAQVGYVRSGAIGESVCSVIKGQRETENTVTRDSDLVMYNASGGGTHYIMTKEEFEASYELKTQKPIDLETTTLEPFIAKNLNEKGYKVVQSKTKKYVHEVTIEDIKWFDEACPRQLGRYKNSSYFVAPWGEYTKVDVGDVLVLDYSGDNNDIYRIERSQFMDSYLSLDVERSLSANFTKIHQETPTSMSKRLEISVRNCEGMRSQTEVQGKFLCLLRNKDSLYSRPPSTITTARRAVAGEVVATVIDGKLENEMVVEDDTSWVVNGVYGERYIVKNHIFNYDVDSARPASNEQLRNEGFKDYNIQTPVEPRYARKISDEDLIWFNEHRDMEKEEEGTAVFESICGKPLKVKKGDMLVSLYNKEKNDEVYMVAGAIFQELYMPHVSEQV